MGLGLGPRISDKQAIGTSKHDGKRNNQDCVLVLLPTRFIILDKVLNFSFLIF